MIIENVPPASGESRKLEPRYRSPYIVDRVLGRDRYVVGEVGDIDRPNRRRFTTVFASDKTKPWCELVPEVDSEDYEGDGADDPLPDDEGSRDGSKQDGPSCDNPGRHIAFGRLGRPRTRSAEGDGKTRVWQLRHNTQ